MRGRPHSRAKTTASSALSQARAATAAKPRSRSRARISALSRVSATVSGDVPGRPSSSLMRAAGRPISPAMLVWVPVKDLVILGAWLMGWVHRTVRWRGRSLTITHGSFLFEPFWQPRQETAEQEAA